MDLTAIAREVVEGKRPGLAESMRQQHQYEWEGEGEYVEPTEAEYVDMLRRMDARELRDCAPPLVEVVTTAPVDYDGFGTTTVEELAFRSRRGDRYRVVVVQEPHHGWQTMRYRSGMHSVTTRAEVAELAEAGILVQA